MTVRKMSCTSLCVLGEKNSYIMSTRCLCVSVFCIAGHMTSLSCLKCEDKLDNWMSRLHKATSCMPKSCVIRDILICWRPDAAEFVGNLSGILQSIKELQKNAWQEFSHLQHCVPVSLASVFQQYRILRIGTSTPTLPDVLCSSQSSA